MRAALLLSAALIAAPAAHAQTRVNDQYQIRGTTAVTTVEVGSADDVGATAVASGNAATSVSTDNDASFDNTQHMDGETAAAVGATVWQADGQVAVTAAAVANGVTSNSTNGDSDVRSDQRAHGDATAIVDFIGGNAADAGTSAAASGNVAAVSAENGQTRFIGSQEATGDVFSGVSADHCCVSGQVVSGAISSANNLTVGGDTATVLVDATQNASGSSVSANVDLYAGYATDASGNATANGNATTIDNQWGYVNARVSQTSTSDVSANSYVTLGGDFLGFASAGAYGVGNQTIVSNVGSDTVMDVAQANSGDVSANAAVSGEGGAMIAASAAAYGNNVSGALCAYCDDNVPELDASSLQTNDADVTASARVVTPRARTVGATATAIGNGATYQVTGPSS